MSASASTRNGSSGRLENAPEMNISKLATASPSDRPKTRAGPAFLVAPARPGAGVEEDADDREVERRPRHLGCLGPGRHRDDAAPAVEPAGREMAPPGMEGDVEARVVLADGRDHHVGGAVQAVEVDREVIEPAGDCVPEERMGAARAPPPPRGDGGRHRGEGAGPSRAFSVRQAAQSTPRGTKFAAARRARRAVAAAGPPHRVGRPLSEGATASARSAGLASQPISTA